MFVHLLSNTDEGKEWEGKYSVKGHPSFVLTTAQGDVIDRWVGYRNPATFVAQLAAGTGDPTTLEQKRARFERSPVAKDAATLGRMSAAAGSRADAVRYYRRALELDPTGPYQQPIFENLVALHAQPDGGVEPREVVDAANAAVGGPTATMETKVAAAFRMLDVAKRAKDPKLAEPFVESALEATDAVADQRRALEIEKALLAGDPEVALRLKRESMDEGWKDDPAALNELAWWSFENRVNLAEAEELAARGVTLSQPGPERAQILDTQAELVALRGDRAQALALMRQAAQDDPGEEHYRKQIARFEKAEPAPSGAR